MSMPPQKVLVFGSTGKLGSALTAAFATASYMVIPLNRSECDVNDHAQVHCKVKQIRPDIVINAIAFNGIDACEASPQQALAINTLFPKLLAELSQIYSFLLVHISSDAVFSGTQGGYFKETSIAAPINLYGFTKFGGDCFVSAIAKRHYITRISVQFGPTPGKAQFIEKMLERIRYGADHLQVSDDIIASPSYSRDVAERIRTLVDERSPFGLYHIANEGKASLYELVKELVRIMEWGVVVEPVPHSTFPSQGIKNTYTPIRSERIAPLRPWRDALMAYCREALIDKGRTDG